ncbi:MAG: SDR family NAD(P)-dependent oxidoreductase, partial [Chloroflexota bacterium]
MHVNPTIEEEYGALTPRYPELRGRVAVVTGGAKGIGLGIALRLAREGMSVVIGDIDGQTLSAAAAAL